MKKRVHIIVSGRVQGVFFRDFVHKHATKLGLTGWVRNSDEGTVEVIAEGDKEQLDQLVENCSKGPMVANVTNEKTEWSDFKDEFSEFEIRY